MAKKKQKNSSDKKINIIITASTIAIILLIALIVVIATVGDKTETGYTDTASTDAISEKPPVEENKFTMGDTLAQLNITENPVATLEMENGGVMTIELYPDVAPNTVCNFIELANSGYYDGLIFHRCIKDFMIQGGCPQGTGTGGPDYSIAGEFSSNGFENNLKHEVGVISTARSSLPDSAGSQFFIMVADTPSLDGQYAAFGKVLSGMDVAYDIVAQETDGNDKPLSDQVIKSIRVDTKGITYPESIKIK